MATINADAPSVIENKQEVLASWDNIHEFLQDEDVCDDLDPHLKIRRTSKNDKGVTPFLTIYKGEIEEGKYKGKPNAFSVDFTSKAFDKLKEDLGDRYEAGAKFDLYAEENVEITKNLSFFAIATEEVDEETGNVTKAMTIIANYKKAPGKRSRGRNSFAYLFE